MVASPASPGSNKACSALIACPPSSHALSWTGVEIEEQPPPLPGLSIEEEAVM
jgi:hypothetical protein